MLPKNRSSLCTCMSLCVWPNLPGSVVLLHIGRVVILLDTHPGPLHKLTGMSMASYQISKCETCAVLSCIHVYIHIFICPSMCCSIYHLLIPVNANLRNIQARVSIHIWHHVNDACKRTSPKAVRQTPAYRSLVAPSNMLCHMGDDTLHWMTVRC